jgi:translation initiation factor 3 subunit J
MADNWDDDDEWDADDDEIDKKLGLTKSTEVPAFDDEEDLALQEKQQADAVEYAKNKAKGTALAAKKKAEQDKKDQLEIARRAAELEAEEEANMTPDELKLKERMRIEQADNENINDLFGGIDDSRGKGAAAETVSGDKLVLKDLPSHLKHARKVANAMRVSPFVLESLVSYCP